jgi:uncharacterized phage-like protein YoqJ
MQNIIFQIDGGIGKSIMATAVCEAIKNQYPKDQLIVITSYPEVFLCNPHVDKCLSHNNLNYFYQDFIEGKKVKPEGHVAVLNNRPTKLVDREEFSAANFAARPR